MSSTLNCSRITGNANVIFRCARKVGLSVNSYSHLSSWRPSYFGVHFTSIRSQPGNPPGPGAGFSTTSMECIRPGHPMATIPRAGVNRLSLARDLANFTVGGMVAKVRCLTPCVVAHKYTRPTMGVMGSDEPAGGRVTWTTRMNAFSKTTR